MASTKERVPRPSQGADDGTATTLPAPDSEAVERFTLRMLDAIDGGSITLMTSIGHQTGLFDALAQMPPATSVEVASRTGLDERYVREWLNAMTVADIVRYDPDTRRYALPAEHAAVLTRAAGTANLARMAQYLPLLATVEQPVIECFSHGGGLSYGHYPRFHALMAEDSGALFDAALVEQILPLVPGLVDDLTEGLDVADVGCGRGHAVNVVAKAFPRSRVTGIDISDEAISVGREEAAAWGLTNARFMVCDAADLADSEQYDLVTAFDAIHDQAHPARVLDRIHSLLRPGGTFLMGDIRASSEVSDNIGQPLAAFLYAISTMHCMTVSLGAGGDGLGAAWGEQLATRMLGEAGFTHVTVESLDEDPVNSYYVARRP